MVRVSSKSPGTSRKEYSILGDSSSSVLDSNGQTEEKQGGSKVRWKNNVQDTEHNGDREDKGHARSTSLDLNKMLLGDNISDGTVMRVCVSACVFKVFVCVYIHLVHVFMRTIHSIKSFTFCVV